MNNKNGKLVRIFFITAGLSLFVGCGTANNAPQTETSTQPPPASTSAAATSSPATTQTQDKPTPSPSRDDELTDKLIKETGVLSGQVYFSGDLVICAIALKDNVKEEDGKKIAQKYADELKKKYKGKTINVQAVLKGKNIANINS